MTWTLERLGMLPSMWILQSSQSKGTSSSWKRLSFHDGGLSCESGHLIAQAVKNLHVAVLMDKNVVSVERWNYMLESSVGSLKERVRKLEAELSKQVEETKAAEEKMKKAEKQAERDRAVAESLRVDMEKAKVDSVLATQRKLMMQVLNGENSQWNPQEEIDKCNSLL